MADNEALKWYVVRTETGVAITEVRARNAEQAVDEARYSCRIVPHVAYGVVLPETLVATEATDMGPCPQKPTMLEIHNSEGGGVFAIC